MKRDTSKCCKDEAVSPRSETAAVAVDVREKVLKDVMFAVHDYSTGVRHGTGSLGQWVIWVVFHIRVTGSLGHHSDPV